MSDFSQVCPIFSTGVYSEVAFDNIGMTAVAPTMNGLVGALLKTTQKGSFKFDRTVIVTDVYCQRMVAQSGTLATVMCKRHATTGGAAGTAVASLAYSFASVVISPLNKVRKMTTAATTFLAADVLGFCLKTTRANAGKYSFIVRYKEM
jgi:hypothetical protein